MSDSPDKIAAWHAAHPELFVPEVALTTMAPFPSLYARDFITYLQARAQTPPEVSRFLDDLLRELTWTYDGWSKAQRDGSAPRLLDDLLNNAANGDDAFYAPVRKFLVDYARANGIEIRSEAAPPSWMMALENDVSTTERASD